MKVANIIIAHKNPQQLLRLVNTFDGKLFHNFVHIDGRRSLKEFKDVVEHPNVTVLPNRLKLVWAGYGFVQVALDAFQLIKSGREKFFYVSLMSGQDYPVKPTEDFYNFLKSSYGKEFFEIVTMDEWPQAYHRYQRFHLIEWTIRGRYRLEDFINVFIPQRKFFPGFTPYGKSAWFTATDKFAEYALDFVNKNPKFIRWIKTVWSPDEFIFNTLVMNSHFRSNVYPGNLRYIDWSEKKVNPKLFRSDDLNALLDNDCFLARKFDDTIDSDILDKLDKYLIPSQWPKGEVPPSH